MALGGGSRCPGVGVAIKEGLMEEVWAGAEPAAGRDWLGRLNCSSSRRREHELLANGDQPVVAGAECQRPAARGR